MNDPLAIGRAVKLTSQIYYTDYYRSEFAITNRSYVEVHYNLLIAVRDVRVARFTRSDGVTITETKSAWGVIDGQEWLTYQVSGSIRGKNSTGSAWLFPVIVLPTGVLSSNAVNWVLTTNLEKLATGLGPAYTGQAYLTDPWLGLVDKRDEETIAPETGEMAMADPGSSGSVVAVSAPVNGFYGIYQRDGTDWMYLYHELLSRYAGSYKLNNIWVFNRDPKQPGKGVLYQKTPNGNGWLYLPPSGPSWDASTWHFIGVESNGAGAWHLLSEDGKYLFWGSGTVVGQYNRALASYGLGYTTDRTKALAFVFQPEEGTW